MEYDIKNIRSLCDRYFEGTASPEEEAVLKEYFRSTEEVPADLKAVQMMFCGFSEVSHMIFSPPVRRSRTVRRIVFGVTTAASVAVCIILAGRDVYGYDADGNAITDPQTALEGTDCLAYLSRLETTIDIAETLTKGMEENN